MVGKILVRLELILYSLFLCSIFSGSTLLIDSHTDRIRDFTRSEEFDYFSWTLQAFDVKILQSSIDSPFYFNYSDRHKIVIDYLQLTGKLIDQESQLNMVYIDPNVKDPDEKSKQLRDEIKVLSQSIDQIAPIAESILEEQITQVIIEQGLSYSGQAIPPVLFHITPLPYNLIISPRDKIEQQTSISLIPDLAVDAQVKLEDQVQKAINVSALVVPVGGIGSYPTMVERSTSLEWLSNTIAHEWIHNWLSLHPLGQRYDFSNQLRTMNETTASIAGDEIGKIVINRYYPELNAKIESTDFIDFPFYKPDPNCIPVIQFDFRAEMHKTRVVVDQLLIDGKIDEAESYMENRRIVFWDNGYPIRKLNQAYFAFYGAYADVPGGAAGEDPVGPAVRALRAESPSLKVFLQKIADITSFDSLLAAISH